MQYQPTPHRLNRALSTVPPLRSRRTQKARGFTLIEVMMAVGILMTGAASILAMQQVSVQANRGAREMTTATDVAQLWVERVRRDSLSWRTNGAGGILATAYLGATPLAGDSGWIAPIPLLAEESYGFDWAGRDTREAGEIRYCTHLNTRWIVPNSVARVDVRVFWTRERGSDTNRTEFVNCAAGGGEGAVTVALANAAPTLSAVHTSTIVRWNQQQ